MRILVVGAALAAAAIAAGQAQAQSQFPTNVKSRAAPGNPFDLGIQKFLALIKPLTSSSSSSTSNTPAPVPIARPQPISPRNTSLSAFIPSPMMPSATPVHGFSIFPSQDQMPGAAYLKAFGARVAPRVTLD
ncbi:MAG TPA: hypothetical protein VKE94_01120 [Gemmataceae bacterium]|nr:hypothetical protein [Gemmataceae bacterium]